MLDPAIFDRMRPGLIPHLAAISVDGDWQPTGALTIRAIRDAYDAGRVTLAQQRLDIRVFALYAIPLKARRPVPRELRFTALPREMNFRPSRRRS